MFNQLITDLKSNTTTNGELLSRTVVIDHLLDLRSAADDNPELTARIDRFLSEVPGVTVVSSEWWIETLDELGKASRFAALV